MKLLFSFALVAGLSMPHSARSATEHDHQRLLCAGMQTNYFLKVSGTYADCITETHAIEVDFSAKWAEAIGQSLHYADVLQRKPGIILVCKRTTTDEICAKHSYLAEQTLANWGIAATIWLCRHEAQALGQCSTIEVTPSNHRH